MSIRTIDTEDKLEYQFIPVTGSQIQFRVRAPNDAHVALTPGPQEGEPMYEVFFGGWGNSKSVIRKNRTKPEVAEAQTPEILSNDETRGFWIRWNENTITAGKEGNNEPLLSYTDPEPIIVGYIGFCTGWGASGQWQLEGYQPITTLNDLKYKFHPVPGAVIIQVKAKSNAHVALTKSKGESSPMYEIMLGGWENTASVIRHDRKQPDKVRKDTPNILHPGEYKQFAICWRNGHIVAKAGDQNGPLILEWKDPNPFGITHVGVRTGWGATGKWNIRFDHLYPTENPTGRSNVLNLAVYRCPVPGAMLVSGRLLRLVTWHWAGSAGQQRQSEVDNLEGEYKFDTVGGPAPSAPSEPSERSVPGSTGIWRESVAGMVPSDAVEGGRDIDGPLYVGRAHHEGALIPGKVNPQHSACYIAWGGVEHGKQQYEVLCGCPSTWVSTSGDNIPPNAVPAGNTEDGEVLFVGRANHEGTVTIGKVQPSHKVLYIPFGGQEVPVPEYEVLVS